MRFFKGVFPNLTISFAAAVLVVAILNEVNPRMGLLQGRAALVLIVLHCICSMVSATALYITWRQGKK